MAINVVTRWWQDGKEFSVFFTVRPNDSKCTHDGDDVLFSPVRTIDPFRDEALLAVIHNNKRYSYVEGGKFTTYQWMNTCCGRDYFPVEVDLRKRDVRVFDFDRNKTSFNHIPDGGPPQKVKFIGLDKATAMQKADELAKSKGLRFIPLEEPACSIL